MKNTTTISLRGMLVDVVIDSAGCDDPSTNAGREIEWHVDGLTPNEQNDLHISDEEEQSIYEQLCRYLDGRDR